jgi:glycosyltransferase involved in cell wall biosynthesis
MGGGAAGIRKVLILGTLPPPVGGVTASVKNELESLAKAGVEAEVLDLGPAALARLAFRRYDLAHVHATRPWKRLLGVLLSRLVARRTLFTVHGLVLRLESRWERLALRLAHGVVLLNDDIERNYRDVFDRLRVRRRVLTPLFSEGLDAADSGERYFDRVPGPRHVLLYAFARVREAGHEVYGVEFVLRQLPRMGKGYRLVFLDPKGEYGEEGRILAGEGHVYLGRPVDFKALLRSVDLYLRPTYFDGNSVAIQEAISLGVPVLASDRVQRPQGVPTYRYGDPEDFHARLGDIDYSRRIPLRLSSVRDLLDFAEKL